MIVCAPVSKDGMIDPRWGRADWVALADVVDGEIVSWQEIEVSWSRLHDEGTSGSHHARVVTFLRDHHVEAVVANHMGEGMLRMLDAMRLPVHLVPLGTPGQPWKPSVTSFDAQLLFNPRQAGLQVPRFGQTRGTSLIRRLACRLPRSTGRTISR